MLLPTPEELLTLWEKPKSQCDDHSCDYCQLIKMLDEEKYKFMFSLALMKSKTPTEFASACYAEGFIAGSDFAETKKLEDLINGSVSKESI